jgi:DNA repair exonuclease SbcCD ATPase subunit
MTPEERRKGIEDYLEAFGVGAMAEEQILALLDALEACEARLEHLEASLAVERDEAKQANLELREMEICPLCSQPVDVLPHVGCPVGAPERGAT